MLTLNTTRQYNIEKHTIRSMTKQAWLSGVILEAKNTVMQYYLGINVADAYFRRCVLIGGLLTC